MSESIEPVTPFTFTLVTPVDGVTEITLRELTVDEIAKLADDSENFGGVRAMKTLIASMAHIEVSTVGRMGQRDFNTCTRYLDSFSSKRPGKPAGRGS